MKLRLSRCVSFFNTFFFSPLWFSFVERKSHFEKLMSQARRCSLYSSGHKKKDRLLDVHPCLRGSAFFAEPDLKANSNIPKANV